MATNPIGIQCPYCGHIHCESDYLADGNFAGSIDCEECNRPLKFRLETTTTWVTEKEGFIVVTNLTLAN